jgi:predicted transcriptional regulator of viral defense system
MVRVTDLERTIVDCIDNMGFAGGLEELILAASLVVLVKEERLLQYLEAYNKQILYQKTGFILSYFQNMRLSERFFYVCKSKVSKNVSFLTNDGQSTSFFKEWKIYAPENILSYLEQGGGENV